MKAESWGYLCGGDKQVVLSFSFFQLHVRAFAQYGYSVSRIDPLGTESNGSFRHREAPNVQLKTLVK